MSGEEDAVTLWVVTLVLSPLWMTGLAVLALGMVVRWVATATFYVGRRLVFGPPSKRQRRRIQRQRAAAFRDLAKITKRTERIMRRIARGGS